MQALAQWWPQWTASTARQAWGLAPLGMAWTLVGLARHSRALAKVHTSVALQATDESPGGHLIWLSQALRQHARARGGRRHRLSMAFPVSDLREGFIDFPAQLSPEEWPFEVQLEVSQALHVSPDAVNFDFAPEPSTDVLVHRVHWMGCLQQHIAQFKDCTRAAGWRLLSVESQTQAAERGVRALQGGMASLLTQAPQDWQFHLNATGNRTDSAIAPDEVVHETLRQVLNSPTGARLVASGLALRAWQ